jgi:pyrroline-5-carboxylate reductase
LRERYGVDVVGTEQAAAAADTLIVTVKPQDMGALLAELAPHCPPDRLVVTAAAGITTSFLEAGSRPAPRWYGSCRTPPCWSTRR